LVGREKCNMCGSSLSYPFLFWWGEKDIFICGQCSAKCKEGLMADLVQIAAIMELRRVHSSMSPAKITLHRMAESEIDAMIERDDAHGRQMLMASMEENELAEEDEPDFLKSEEDCDG